jgi:hypothetical protein
MHSNRRLVPMVAVVGALFMLGSPPAGAQLPSDPCALLTPAQVSGVLGGTVGKGEPIGSTGCAWATPPQGTAPYLRATLSLWDGSAFAGMKAPLPGIKNEPAPGIGDDAVYATVGSLTTLSVKKGNVAFVVRLYGVHDQARQMAMEKALALDVIAKL